MTMKGLSRKQVLIYMSKDNTKVIGKNTSFYINFINKSLYKANLKTMANFICLDKSGIIITTDQVASVQDMNIIEDFLKNSENINHNLIKSPCLH